MVCYAPHGNWPVEGLPLCHVISRFSVKRAGAAVDPWTLPDELSQVDVAITKSSLNQR
jgi:hypothetical protein